HTANLDYEMADGVMHITHTRVPEAIGGRGIAGRLVEAALHHARAEGWKVRLLCDYARGWVARHPGAVDGLLGCTAGAGRPGRAIPGAGGRAPAADGRWAPFTLASESAVWCAHCSKRDHGTSWLRCGRSKVSRPVTAGS